MKFKDIVNEIAWKCKDGMPNFKRDDDVILLKNQLIKESWSTEAIYALLDNLGLSEDDKWWTKLSPEQQAQYIKDHPKSKKDAKRKEKGEEPKEPVDKEEEELSVDYHDELESEHKNPMVEKQIKEAEARLEDKSNTLDSTEVTDRIKSTKTNVDDVTSSIGVELRLGDKRANINKTNIVDVIFKPNRQFNFHYEVPEMQRGSSLEKLAEDLKSKGWTDIEYNSKRIIAHSPDGKKYVIHSKPDKTKSKKQIGEATAYEGVVALAYAIADSDYTEEELGTIIETLVSKRKFVTKSGVSVDTLSLRADAAEFFSNPENTEKLKEQLKAILSNPKLAVEMAAAKDLLNKGDFPEGTKLRVDCEGGADTDEFRADIVIYAETPDGERTALIASSVKDGKNVQLAQLGPRRAVDAINDTEPGSDERREMILHHPTDKSAYIHQIQKLPESMQGAYMERIMQAENPDELHIELMNGVLDAADDDPRAIYDFMMFSIVGHDPPEGVGSFLYQNAGKVSRVPLTGSKEAEKMVSKITELYKSGRIRKSEDPEKGDFLMYIDDDGNEIPLLKTRSKYTNDGNLERVLVEKGGRKSALLKLLSGELD